MIIMDLFMEVLLGMIGFVGIESMIHSKLKKLIQSKIWNLLLSIWLVSVLIFQQRKILFHY